MNTVNTINLTEKKNDIYAQLASILKISSAKNYEKAYELIKQNINQLNSNEQIKNLKEIIYNNQINAKTFFRLYFLILDTFQDKEEETIEKIKLKINSELLDLFLTNNITIENLPEVFNKLLKKLKDKDDKLHNLENYLKSIESENKMLKAKLIEYGNLINEALDQIKKLKEKNEKLEEFILFLKKKKIILPTSSWGLKINPLIEEKVKKIKIIKPENKKIKKFKTESKNIIITDKNSSIQKYQFKELEEKNNKKENSNIDTDFAKFDMLADWMLEIENIAKENKKLIKENQQLQNSLITKNNELIKLQEENQSLKNENKKLQEKNQELEEENKKLLKELQELKAKLNSDPVNYSA